MHNSQDGQIRDAAILIAVGVNQLRKWHLLGVSVSLGEQEFQWHTFLQSLVARGLGCTQLIISDNRAGLKAAREMVESGGACVIFGERVWDEHVSYEIVQDIYELIHSCN